MPKESAKILKTLNYLIRAAIILFTYGFIYWQVFRKQRPAEVLREVESLLMRKEAWGTLAIILLMMLVNWGLESRKWQLLIGKIEKIGFLKSYKAVLTGVSISLFTPNRTGDYLGRVFILEKGNPVEGILVTIVGSFAQLVVTLCVGLFCFLSFFDQYMVLSFKLHDYLLFGLIFIVPVSVFLLLLFYYRIGMMKEVLKKIIPDRWGKYLEYTSVFGQYSGVELTINLLLSLARYIVFCAQFYLLLHIFGTGIPASQALILIPVIYLIMTIVPTIALADLGIRGSVALFMFGLYFTRYGEATGNTDIAILTATTMLWFINLIIPAVLGTFFVFNLKFFRK